MHHIKRNDFELNARAASYVGKYVTTTDGQRGKVLSALPNRGRISMYVDPGGPAVKCFTTDNEHATIDRNQDEEPSSKDYHHGNH